MWENSGCSETVPPPDHTPSVHLPRATIAHSGRGGARPRSAARFTESSGATSGVLPAAGRKPASASPTKRTRTKERDSWEREGERESKSERMTDRERMKEERKTQSVALQRTRDQNPSTFVLLLLLVFCGDVFFLQKLYDDFCFVFVFCFFFLVPPPFLGLLYMP